VYFAMKSIRWNDAVRRSAYLTLLGALVLTNTGCGASNSNAGSGNPPVATIASVNPTSGAVGAPVTIDGANFGATQGTSTVKFNGTSATPTSWSATSIVVPVPAGATTGNVVVTVGGVASNGLSFTVNPAVSAPSITSLNPTSGAVGASVTIDGANFGTAQGTSTIKFSGTTATATAWSASTIATTVPAGATTGNVVVTVGGVASNGVSFTVSSGLSAAMGPLAQSTVNSHYFAMPNGQAVYLTGSDTWNDVQNTDQSSTPGAFPFTNYVSMLKTNGHNTTILWRKDMPRECNWNGGGTWNLAPQPWMRSTTAGASDGGNKFDLTQFNQAYFDKMRSEALTLQTNGIYAIVELFDGSSLANYRCGTTFPNGDGFPLTGINNINGVDDGYTSGKAGVGSVTMTGNNGITAVQDAYVKKMLDTLNDLQNVIYEIGEEVPGSSFSGTPGYGGASIMSWWAPHMFELIKTYEGGGTCVSCGNMTFAAKPLQHLAGMGSMAYGDRVGGDAGLYASTADWIAPAINAGVDMFPSNVSTNNQGKLVINDSDHALGWSAFVNSSTGAIDDVHLRGYVWENFTNGAAGLLFMDPYVVNWTTNQRNPCASPVNGICPSPMTKYDPFRAAMGYTESLVAKLDLVKMTPQGNLSSTGFCLAQNAAVGGEYVVYAPNGGTFTVDLSATNRLINVEWFNPATGIPTVVPAIMGGSSAHSFTAPFSGDAVLYLVDAAGHN
jgi:hypothetical protein